MLQILTPKRGLRPIDAGQRCEAGHREVDTMVSPTRAGGTAALSVLCDLRKLPDLRPSSHARVARALKASTYFCRPYHSWEKGTVENTIGRVRRFLPKGADLAACSRRDIARIEDWLNHTPRKCCP